MNQNFQVGVYEKAFPEDISVFRMLELAKSAGYDFYELSIDRTDKRIARLTDSLFISSLKKNLNDLEIKLSSFGLSAIGTYTIGNPDEEICNKGMKIFQDAIEFADKLDVRIVQIPGADMPKFDSRSQNTKERFFTNLQKMVAIAAKYGIILGLENMENDFMDTTKKSMELIEFISSPYFQLYTDSGNLTNAFKGNLEEIMSDMATGKGHYCAFHLKEVRENKYGGLFYGEGCVPFEPIAKKAYELGARRFCMEYWYTGNPEWEKDLRIAKDSCIKWLSE